MLRYTTSLSNDFGPSEALVSLDDRSTSISAQPLTQHTYARSSNLPWINNPAPTPGALVTKLSSFVRLDQKEIDALKSLSRNSKPFRSEQILIHEGSPTNSICLIVKGLACRYKMLAGGRRQILGYLIPGDMCDIHFSVANKPDYSVALIGDSLVARIPTSKMDQLIALYPKIGRALTMAAIIDGVILREWLLSIGQRDALQKLCHLFCEMAVRLEAIGGINDDGSFELPVNQVTLADTLGLTPVHINRTLQRLRNEGLIRLCHRRLAILDRERLATIAGFDGAYLQLGLVAA